MVSIQSWKEKGVVVTEIKWWEERKSKCVNVCEYNSLSALCAMRWARPVTVFRHNFLLPSLSSAYCVFLFLSLRQIAGCSSRGGTWLLHLIFIKLLFKPYPLNPSASVRPFTAFIAFKLLAVSLALSLCFSQRSSSGLLHCFFQLHLPCLLRIPLCNPWIVCLSLYILVPSLNLLCVLHLSKLHKLDLGQCKWTVKGLIIFQMRMISTRSHQEEVSVDSHSFCRSRWGSWQVHTLI